MKKELLEAIKRANELREGVGILEVSLSCLHEAKQKYTDGMAKMSFFLDDKDEDASDEIVKTFKSLSTHLESTVTQIDAVVSKQIDTKKKANAT